MIRVWGSQGLKFPEQINGEKKDAHKGGFRYLRRGLWSSAEYGLMHTSEKAPRPWRDHQKRSGILIAMKYTGLRLGHESTNWSRKI